MSKTVVIRGLSTQFSADDLEALKKTHGVDRVVTWAGRGRPPKDAIVFTDNPKVKIAKDPNDVVLKRYAA